jgi:hypothetical protein
MRTHLYGLLAALPLLGGCSLAAVDGYPKRADVSSAYVEELGGYLKPVAVQDYTTVLDEPRRAVLRNEIITARMYAMDVNFHQFEQDLTQQHNIANVGSDWAILALSGAGTIVPSAATKTVLAATTTAIAGGKAVVDKDIFYTKTIPALLTQMEAQRKIIRARIIENMLKTTRDYTLFQGLADLDEYYAAGSLNGAIVALTTTAGAKSDQGDSDIANVTKGKPLRIKKKPRES